MLGGAKAAVAYVSGAQRENQVTGNGNEMEDNGYNEEDSLHYADGNGQLNLDPEYSKDFNSAYVKVPCSMLTFEARREDLHGAGQHSPHLTRGDYAPRTHSKHLWIKFSRKP